MHAAAVISRPADLFLWAFRQHACSLPVGQHALTAANAAAASGANPAKEKNSARHTAAAPRNPLRICTHFSMPSREVYHNSDLLQRNRYLFDVVEPCFRTMAALPVTPDGAVSAT
jgi:hypothetical protein